MSKAKTSHLNFFQKIKHTFSSSPKSTNDVLEQLKQAYHNQLLDHEALQMIEKVIQMAHMTVADVMISRPQMVMLDADLSAQSALAIISDSAHSRFPVFDSTQETVTGIILAKDIFQFLQQSTVDMPLGQLVRPATFIPESKRLNVLLREFRLKHNHMAIVIDEYGKVDGLITIEDVLEQIVGDIEDEYDAEDEEFTFIKQIDARVAHIDALTPIETFNQYFEKTFDNATFDTIGGLIIHHFNRLPNVGEMVEIEDLEITVLEATERSIKKLRIYRNPPKKD
jgi:magnesium and cobalt transporter